MSLAEQARGIERARSALRAGLFALVALAPLPFGAVQPGAVLALELWAVLLGCSAAVLAVAERRHPGRTALTMLGLAAIVVAVGAAQLVPRAADATTLVPSATTEIRGATWSAVPEAAPSHVTASLDAPATADALLRFTAYIAIAFATLVALRRRRHVIAAAVVVAAAGSFQALYGAAEYLSGHQHIFGYEKIHYSDEASGTFINRNHFAGFLAACLPPALVLAIVAGAGREAVSDWRERLIRLVEPAGLRRSFALLAAGSIWVGVILSYSRGGLVVALLASGLLGWLVAADRRRVVVIGLALALPTTAILLRDVRAPGERFVADSARIETLNGRLPVWQSTSRMAIEFLPLGSGLGTFEVAFPHYRDERVAARWEHAHNDWLQLLAEGGPLSGAAILGIFGALIATLARLARRGGTAGLLGLGSGCGVIAAAMHAAVDFPLRIPAIAVLLAFLVGATLAASRLRPAGETP